MFKRAQECIASKTFAQHVYAYMSMLIYVNYVYVCLCVYKCAQESIAFKTFVQRVYTHIYIYIYTHVYICIYICTYRYIYICIYIYVYIHIYREREREIHICIIL